MKKTTAIKLDDALANAEKYIKQMQKMDDKKLAKHLDLYEQQMQKAFEQNNEEAHKLLYEYYWQTLTARVNKNFTHK